MRAATITHVEYEILLHVLSEVDLTDVRWEMVPDGDEIADKRFKQGAANVRALLQNLADRRTHRLPKAHPDGRLKGVGT